MNFKTVWEWISSNGWPLLMNNNVAIKYFNENFSDSVRNLTYIDISTLANEVNEFIFQNPGLNFSFRYTDKFRTLTFMNS